MEINNIIKQLRTANNLTQGCKWCYTNGEFVYKTKEHLLDFLINSIPNPENINADERRNQFDLYLSQLKHWK